MATGLGDLSDVIWAAGFFDGEGCVSGSFGMNYQNDRRALALKVAIAQTVAAPLEIFQRLWGGTVRTKQSGNPRHKQQWMWCLSGTTAIPFLEDVLPYLRVKREVAELGLALLRTIRPRGNYAVSDELMAYRIPIVEEMRRLNHRGVRGVVPRRPPGPMRREVA